MQVPPLREFLSGTHLSGLADADKNDKFAQLVMTEKLRNRKVNENITMKDPLRRKEGS